MNHKDWDFVNRRLVAKMLSEMEYEQVFHAESQGDDHYCINLPGAQWRFIAERGIWGWLWIDAQTLRCTDEPVLAQTLLMQLKQVLSMSDATVAEHMQDLYATLLGDLQLLKARRGLSASDLINLDADRLQCLLSGHPKFVFNKGRRGWGKEALERYLRLDAADPSSDNDFGKNVIPAMLRASEKLLAYPFEGYWKDVGTLDSLWEANMDLLGAQPKFNLHDNNWRIFSRSNIEPPHFVGDDAHISDSILTEGCRVNGVVCHSVLFEGAVVEPGAVVRDAVLMGNVVIRRGAHVEYCIIDENTVIGEDAVVGKARAQGGKLSVICSNVKIKDGAMIEDGVIAGASYLKERGNI